MNCEQFKHANADGLRRLPLSDTVLNAHIHSETILLMDQLEVMPVRAELIRLDSLKPSPTAGLPKSSPGLG